MKEVISLPAAQTMDLIKKYLIHAHPHPRSYKEAQYMTFRRVGGVMDTLYSVEQELVLKPEEQNIYEQYEPLCSTKSVFWLNLNMNPIPALPSPIDKFTEEPLKAKMYIDV